jgi:N-acyl-L-homoserine lactone synthetase
MPPGIFILLHEMFRLRAHVFHGRLGWDVGVTDGLDAVTQTQFANGYQKIGGDLDLRASRIVAIANTYLKITRLCQRVGFDVEILGYTDRFGERVFLCSSEMNAAAVAGIESRRWTV